MLLLAATARRRTLTRNEVVSALASVVRGLLLSKEGQRRQSVVIDEHRVGTGLEEKTDLGTCIWSVAVVVAGKVECCPSVITLHIDSSLDAEVLQQTFQSVGSSSRMRGDQPNLQSRVRSAPRSSKASITSREAVLWRAVPPSPTLALMYAPFSSIKSMVSGRLSKNRTATCNGI
jgi:hypothetical protein